MSSLGYTGSTVLELRKVWFSLTSGWGVMSFPFIIRTMERPRVLYMIDEDSFHTSLQVGFVILLGRSFYRHEVEIPLNGRF